MLIVSAAQFFSGLKNICYFCIEMKNKSIDMALVNHSTCVNEAITGHLYIYAKNCRGYNLYFFSAFKAFNTLTPAL